MTSDSSNLYSGLYTGPDIIDRLQSGESLPYIVQFLNPSETQAVKEEVWTMAIAINPRSIAWMIADDDVPDRLYRLAVEKDPETLRYVPRERRTRELCLTALRGGGVSTVLDHENDYCIDDDVIREASQIDLRAVVEAGYRPVGRPIRGWIMRWFGI